MGPITLHYNFTEEDQIWLWRRSSLDSLNKSPFRKRRILFNTVIAYICLGLLVKAYVPSLPLVVFIWAILIALAALTPRWYEQQVEKVLKEQISDLKLKGNFGPHKLLLTSGGLREITPVTDTLAKWKDVMEVTEDGAYIIIRIGSGLAAVINRASYSGEVPFDDIPKIINERKAQTAT